MFSTFPFTSGIYIYFEVKGQYNAALATEEYSAALAYRGGQSPTGEIYFVFVSNRPNALIIHSQSEALGELVELLEGPLLHVHTAKNQTEALVRLRKQNFSIVIACDKPPLLDGIKLLNMSVSLMPNATRILMTEGSASLENDVFFDTPHPIIRFGGQASERSRLIALVHEGLHLKSLIKQQEHLVAKLQGKQKKLLNREKLLDIVVQERTNELKESYMHLKTANRQALFGLAEAIEAKDPYTKGHCGRVAAYSMLLAQKSGYPNEKMEALEFGAFLHDIGKIGVRDSVLLKPGPLDDDEWMHMREHPVVGFEIASKIRMLDSVIPAIRNHHERWDGSGYPDKLAGLAIPQCARIVAIADAYDAMSTDRPYKEAMPIEKCEAILRKNAGIMFDEELVEVFCTHHIGDSFVEGNYEEY